MPALAARLLLALSIVARSVVAEQIVRGEAVGFLRSARGIVKQTRDEIVALSADICSDRFQVRKHAHVCGKLFALGLACGSTLPSLCQTGAGLLRAIRFWQLSLPIYADYRWSQYRLGGSTGELSEETERAWNELHEKHAPTILQLALELRGFYVKLGQVASTRGDMFPRPWTRALQKLQGEHPELLARPLERVWRVVRRDLGARAAMILEIETDAVGAAATGQVHRALLRDGREVVVKVQYPEAHRLYRQDFANCKLFCALLQPEHLSYINELEKQFYTEFDFRREATDLAEISENFGASSGNPFSGKVRVPVPVLELSSRNVVVMEYLPGETLLSYGMRRKRKLEKAAFFTRIWQGFWLLRELRAHLDLLVGVQGHQIFVDGTFNGDPHPGNILLMPDGRLGLIDYGNVKRFDAIQRAKLGRLVVALASEDRDAVVASAREIGFRTRQNNPEVIFRLARLAFDRDDAASMVLPDGTAPANVQVYFESLDALDPLEQMPPGFVMAMRNSFLLRGLATHFGLTLSMARRWRHLAEGAVAAVGHDSAPHR